MIHDAHTTCGKKVVRDIKIKAQELNRKNEILVSLLSQDSGVEIDKIRNMMERDCYMSAQEAKELGLVDFIVEKPILDIGGSASSDSAKDPLEPKKVEPKKVD